LRIHVSLLFLSLFFSAAGAKTSIIHLLPNFEHLAAPFAQLVQAINKVCLSDPNAPSQWKTSHIQPFFSAACICGRHFAGD
jgi:hypothetical protein